MKTTKGLAMLAVLVLVAFAQEKQIKRGLTPDDWKYSLAPGVTTKEITYYSDEVPCYGKIFFPKGFSAQGKTPGVVLGQGWAGTHFSIEKYAARFAEKGLAAMVIDYRGWGMSSGFLTIPGPDPTGGGPQRDDTRFKKATAEIVLKRTRLLPLKQVEDYRNAISYLQGEPGVDPDRIGVWGSSFAGGHSLVVAALDARVKAVAVQVPAVGGKGVAPGPYQLQGKQLQDAIERARNGQGEQYKTGFSALRDVDVETQQAVAEYRPYHYVQYLGALPVLFIVAEKDELINNENQSHSAYAMLTGPKDYIVVPNITHFEMYIGKPFETSSNAAANWFVKYLGVK